MKLTAATATLLIIVTLIIVVPSSIINVVVNAQQTTNQQTNNQRQTQQQAGVVGNNVFIEDLIPNPNRIMDISFGYWCSDAAFDCAFRMFATLGGELVMIDSVSSYL
jgi:predicted PurR-regulated permease PerM